MTSSPSFLLPARAAEHHRSSCIAIIEYRRASSGLLFIVLNGWLGNRRGDLYNVVLVNEPLVSFAEIFLIERQCCATMCSARLRQRR